MEPYATELFNTLKELNVVDQTVLENQFNESKKNNSSFREQLLTHDLISDNDLGKTVAEILHMPYVDLSAIQIDPNIVAIFPESYAKNHSIIAFEETPDEIKLAVEHPPLNGLVLHLIEQKTHKKIAQYYCTERDFEKSLKLFKQDLQQSYDTMLKEQVASYGKTAATEAPIEKIVSILIEYAYDNGASDIHLEPEKNKSVIRFRVDGVMQEVLHIPLEIHLQIISRIKYLAKLRTDEHLSAQDGKIQTHVEQEDVDIRVSIVPVIHGEKCVMRVLSSRYRQFGLADLGMNEADLKKVTDASAKPYGMILSTGPTGSGKTSTMYAILKILNTRERNIATIEDPVEYEIEGLNQIQVNPKTNLTFAEGLRSILRQDPNIIYVGEIRDEETADIAVNSAMTGHLVLSTLHTNNAATALPRLLDMKIEPFLVASTVNIVIAQRLVRKICDSCKVSDTVARTTLEVLFGAGLINTYFKDSSDVRLYRGKGCRVCRNSGYAGRIGIFEVLSLSKPIQDLIVAKSDYQNIMQQAMKEGMTTMVEDGLMKVQAGLTTTEEILRAIKE